MVFTSYGVRVGVRVDDGGVLDDIGDRLPPGWRPSRQLSVELLYSIIAGGEGSRAGRRRFSLLYAEGTRLARSLQLEDVLETFEGDVKLRVAENARRRVFVHAGVVGWKGQAIIVPGRSFTGKTTLVAELVRAGATYYSDEYAVLDFRGRVHPYSRPLAIRPSEGGGRSRRYSVEELGGRAGIRPLPVGLVLVSQYRRGAKWRPRSLSAGQGALALLDNTISIRQQPQAAFDAMRQVVIHAPILQGARGEASEIARAILNIL